VRERKRNVSRFSSVSVQKFLDQKFRPKKLYFFLKAKRGLKTTGGGGVFYISITSTHCFIYQIYNGGKQKRDADFTETATQKKTFMFRGLAFDFWSARVEKSIDR